MGGWTLNFLTIYYVDDCGFLTQAGQGPALKFVFPGVVTSCQSVTRTLRLFKLDDCGTLKRRPRAQVTRYLVA